MPLEAELHSERSALAASSRAEPLVHDTFGSVYWSGASNASEGAWYEISAIPGRHEENVCSSFREKSTNEPARTGTSQTPPPSNRSRGHRQ